jgi:hypothetical protein
VAVVLLLRFRRQSQPGARPPAPVGRGSVFTEAEQLEVSTQPAV